MHLLPSLDLVSSPLPGYETICYHGCMDEFEAVVTVQIGTKMFKMFILRTVKEIVSN